MPKADKIGNIKQIADLSRVQEDDIYQSFEDDSLKLAIEGLILCDCVPPGSITCSLDYYRVKLEDQLTKLETEDVFSTKRNQVSPVVREFVKNSLPGLSLFSGEEYAAITFTHCDFSPRNILISESSPPVVTGILDFEFAGFFPNEEEFTNNAIANADDWPGPAYGSFLDGEARSQDTSATHRSEVVEGSVWTCAHHGEHCSLVSQRRRYKRDRIGGGTEKSR